MQRRSGTNRNLAFNLFCIISYRLKTGPTAQQLQDHSTRRTTENEAVAEGRGRGTGKPERNEDITSEAVSWGA